VALLCSALLSVWLDETVLIVDDIVCTFGYVTKFLISTRLASSSNTTVVTTQTTTHLALFT